MAADQTPLKDVPCTCPAHAATPLADDPCPTCGAEQFHCTKCGRLQCGPCGEVLFDSAAGWLCESCHLAAPSLAELWGAVQAHPDYVFGALWAREDVAEALLDDDWSDAPADPIEWIGKLTDEQVSEAATTFESYIFNGSYSWREAIRDNVPAGEFPSGTEVA